MAAMAKPPMTEAEAFVTEGAREISERLHDLLSQHRSTRRRPARLLVQAAADHPLAAAAAFVVGAVLAALVADRLIGRASYPG